MSYLELDRETDISSTQYDMSFCNEKCSKYISKKTITTYTNCCSKAFTDVVVEVPTH